VIHFAIAGVLRRERAKLKAKLMMEGAREASAAQRE